MNDIMASSAVESESTDSILAAISTASLYVLVLNLGISTIHAHIHRILPVRPQRTDHAHML